MGAQLDPANTPLTYGDSLEEYWAVRRSVGIADISSNGRLLVAGKDGISFLNGLLTNDVTKISEGQGQRSALLTPKARVLSDLHLYYQPNAILVDTGDSPSSKVKEDLDRFVITEDVQIRNATDDIVQMTVQGPKSTRAVKETLGVEVGDLKSLQQRNVGPATIVARDRTGHGGYDLFLPNDEAEAVWQGFLLKGGDIGIRPVGKSAMEILRVEAGYPKYGADISEEFIVLEAGFKDAISFTKGCYMGQEVVARATHIGRVNKQLVGLKIETRDPIAPRTKLKKDSVDAGFITSAVFSPALNNVAGLGYAVRDYASVGANLRADTHTGLAEVQVTKVI